MIPAAFLGSATSGDIYATDTGTSDAGEPIGIRIQSNPFAPAGATMDCTFERVYLTLTWSMDAVLLITPILDGVPLDRDSWTLALARPATGRRKYQVFERVMRRTKQSTIPYKYALRGTWFALRIETVGQLGEGDLILDQVALEFEPLQPTMRQP